MKFFYSLIILLMCNSMSGFSQQEINASSESLLTVLRVSNSLTATAAAGKGAAISIGAPGAVYSTKIATIFEQSNPSYLNPALAFFTMHNTYLAGTEVERMRISSNGNVGIGTVNPDKAQLQVAKSTGGTIAITTNGNSGTDGSPLAPSLDFLGYLDGPKARIRALERTYNGYGSSLILSVKSNEDATTMKDVITLKYDGNVGIGTNAPIAQTEIFGAGQITAALTDAGLRTGIMALNGGITGVAGEGGALTFGNIQTHNINSMGFAAIKGLLTDGSGNTKGHLAFSTRDDPSSSSLTERLRIQDNGFVGIGTTTPNKTLEVAGSIAAGAFEGITINNATNYGDGLGVASARLNFNRTGTDDGRMSYIEGGNTRENDSGDGFLALGTRTSNTLFERMRITHSGNVGIGTRSAEARLQLEGSPTTGAVGTETILKLGRALTDATSFQQVVDFNLGRYATPGGTYENFGRFDIAMKGNNPVSNYTADVTVMSLLNNGSVGIGTTSPNASAKLDVNGNIFSSGKILIGINDVAKATTYSLAVNGDAIFNKVRIVAASHWADYVFEDSYSLMPLSDLAKYIKVNKHLPDVPTTADVEKEGTDIGNTQTLLLKKVEELTLYLIELNQKVESLSNENELLKKQLKR